MPLIVLLTDFGTKDHFVGVVKGVISQINPLARIVDLTHEIQPQNVRQGAFVLWASRKFFPDDSIFVSIVDPGVGTERKVICGRLDGRLFVAPDNGLFDSVVAEAGESEFYEVTNRRLFLPALSSTFHGRDIFAPVSAHLSRGLRLSELGQRFNYPAVATFYKKLEKGRNAGEIVYQDRFGNMITNFLWEDSLLSGGASVKIGSKTITKFVRSYSEAKGNAPVCIEGSNGLIEIAVNLGDASKSLKAAIGQKTILVRK